MLQPPEWSINPKRFNEQYEEIKTFFLQTPSDFKPGKFYGLADFQIEQRDFMQDCAKIGAFFQDEIAVLRQLQKLESILCEKALNEGLIVEENGQLKIQADPLKGGFLQHIKVLRNTLESELAQFGFNPHFGKAVQYVQPKNFRAALRRGLMLKDPGADVPHGEFSHAIQWIILAYQNQEYSFLTQSVIDIFKGLGEEQLSLSPKRRAENESNLWNMIFDQEDSGDLRTPDNWGLFIKKHKHILFTLNAIYESRENKRKNSPFFDTPNKHKAKANNGTYGIVNDNILYPYCSS